MKRIAFALFVLFVVLAGDAIGPARAAEAPVVVDAATEDAHKLFIAGRQAYRNGRFELAIESFKDAYTISKEPGLLFDLGQAYRKRFLITDPPQPALLADALAAYRRYLAESPGGAHRNDALQYLEDLAPVMARIVPGPGTAAVEQSAPRAARTQLLIVTEIDGAEVTLDGAERKPSPLLADVTPGEHHAIVEAPGYLPRALRLLAVADRLVATEARLDPRPGHLLVEGRVGARLAIDGQPAARMPLASALELRPGAHDLVLSARGHEPWSRAIDLLPGQDLRLRATQRETRQRGAVRWLALAAAVAGGVGAGGGIVWGQGAAAANEIDRRRLSTGITQSDLRDYEGDVRRAEVAQTITWAGVGLAAGLALVTGALFLFDNPAPPERGAN